VAVLPPAERADPPRVPTVKEFAPVFLTSSALRNKPSTVRAKEQLLRTHILARLGHLRLDQVTYGTIEDFTIALSKTPLPRAARPPRPPAATPATRTLTPKTINNCLTVLRRMLSIARKRGLIAAVPDVDWLRVPPAEFDFLTFAEADRLLAAGDGEWRTMFLVALRTGLRVGELLAPRSAGSRQNVVALAYMVRADEGRLEAAGGVETIARISASGVNMDPWPMSGRMHPPRIKKE